MCNPEQWMVSTNWLLSKGFLARRAAGTFWPDFLSSGCNARLGHCPRRRPPLLLPEGGVDAVRRLVELHPGRVAAGNRLGFHGHRCGRRPDIQAFCSE